MPTINLKKVVNGQMNEIINKLVVSLDEQGFGVLAKINFHEKIKEKLNEEIGPIVILGVCDPSFVYQAYKSNTDVTSLIPCNAVIRMIDDERVSIELAKPSVLLSLLDDKELERVAIEADFKLTKVLENF